ncbi:hypothetical protein B5807_01781 [Epicoccum nigrum]|uniref:Uncharacterized protein n=1 Tax=Epicoccum nigrum TaxID=105696 RepID=A0A1Y2MD11_EPING|nr:hypothetical protein B5807_01781 [Epicoccum nigrum]
MEEVSGSFNYLAADLRSFDDVNLQLERRIRELSTEDPYTQTQYDEDLEARHDLNNRVYCICISDFFTDQGNLIYYIKGTQNVSMFSLGMTGMDAFDGAVLFIVCPYNFSHVLDPINIKHGKVERLAKRYAPLEHVKWQYIFETGRLVWNKSDVDLGKLEALMEKKSAQSGSRSSSNFGDQTGISRLPLASSESLSKMIDTTSKSPRTGERRRSESCVPGNKPKENETNRDLPRSDSVIGELDDSHFDGQTEQDRQYLETYLKMTSSNLDELWVDLKNHVLEDVFGHDPKHKILPIMFLEEKLAKCRAETPDIIEDTNKLSQIDMDIRVHRNRFFQGVANTWAEKWQRNCALRLSQRLLESKARNDSRRDVKSWLMVALMLWDNDAPQISKMGLETHEVQAVIDLADNYELEKECVEQIEAMDPENTMLPALCQTRLSLEEQEREAISTLVPILFNRFGHIGLEDLTFLSTMDLNEHGLTLSQEEILANTMEAMNTRDRELATRLLGQSHWVAEAALAKWWDRDTPPELPTKKEQASWSAKKLGKRPVVVKELEVGESSKKKSTSLSLRNGKREESPEESLEEARARLERIVAGTRKGG